MKRNKMDMYCSPDDSFTHGNADTFKTKLHIGILEFYFSHLLNTAILRAGVEVSLDGLVAVLRVVHPHACRDPLHVLKAPLSSSILFYLDGSLKECSSGLFCEYPIRIATCEL